MFSGYFDPALSHLGHDRFKVFRAFGPAFQIAGMSFYKTSFPRRLAIADFVILSIFVIYGQPPSVQRVHQRICRFPYELHDLLYVFATA